MRPTPGDRAFIRRALKEDLLALTLSDLVALRFLARVAWIPLEACAAS